MVFVLSSFSNAITSDVTAKPSDPDPIVTVEQAVLDEMESKGTASYLIYFRDRPNLAAAADMDWIQRGRYVVQQLQSAAQTSQKAIRAYLDSNHVKYQSFWIDNVILVESSDSVALQGLTRFPEISNIRERRTEMLIEPVSKTPVGIDQIMAIEPNISHVQAPDAWALGVNGTGSVVASIDTGVRYTHQALVGKYRGNLGNGTFNHNYNWWDPYGDHPTAPADDNGHGSHTMGTMVGDDGGSNQIGMAPGAEWLACRGCSTTSCSDTALLECAQFITAPWDLNEANPNPDLRPDVVNNSWGDCGTSYDPWYRGVVDSWRAAGIYPVFSNGNASNCGYSSPPACGTVGNPARYSNVSGVGATGQSNGAYATFSNRGPSDNLDTENGGAYPSIKPQVAAPGSNIRSSVNTSDTAYEGGWSGTSMAAPHVAGLVALMYQAGSCLRGDFVTTENIIQQTAALATGVPPACSGEGPGQVPNQSTGWGEIRALAAVQMALTSCGPMGTLEGTVTVTGTTTPIAGALVQAIGTDQTWQTTTNAAGHFSLTLGVGTYTVNFSAYGYMPKTSSGVVITEDTTTTLNVTLDTAPIYTVSGKVFDPAAGWGLYAKLTIDGYHGDPIWTDPATGNYSIQLVAGQNYTFNADVFSAGYLPAALDTGVLAGPLVLDIPVPADTNNCVAPGYVLDVTGVYETFESDTFPPAGWTVTLSSGSCTWVGDDPGNRGNLTGGTGKFAIADSDNCGSGTTMNTFLTSPIMDVSALANVNLSYNYDYNNLVSTESADLDVSANGGATWTNVHHWNTDMRGPNTFTQDLTTLLAGSTQAQLRYHYIAPGWDWWWQVDNVFVGEKDCHPIGGGGLVVGKVIDDFDDHALVGAKVTSETLAEATAVATADPDMGNFYALFQPAGAHTLTATMPKYTSATVDVTVPTGSAIRQDFALQTGRLSYTPVKIEETLLAGTQKTVQVIVTNNGGGDATFEIIELDKGSVPFRVLTPEDFEQTPASIAHAPKVSSEPVINSPSPLAGVPAIAMDIYPGGNLVSFNTDTPGTLTTIGSLGADEYYAGDFVAGDFTKLYAIDTTTNQLVTFATTNAARSVVGPTAVSGGQSWTGVSYDAVTSQLYALSTDCLGASTLYAVDPATGASTVLQSLTNTTCPIDIAASPAGDIFAVDLGNDTLIKIDPATGSATTIGAIGFNANYAQGMDFDDESGVLYYAAYNGDTSAGQLRTINTATGATTLIGNFQGNAEVDGLAIQTGGGGGGVDVPWLSEDPTEVTLAAGANITIDVTLDSTNVAPGVYNAELKFIHDTPYAVPNLPVKMIASIPPTMGKLMGTVLTTGYCDLEQTPLAGVPVTVTSASFTEPLILTTAADGSYSVWLDLTASPLTVDVNAGVDYETGSATGVILNGGQTTFQDFTLRYLKPCLNAAPSSLMATLPLGTSTTRPLTLRNNGGADATFAFDNIATGYTAPANAPLSQPVNTITIGDLTFSADPNPPKESSDPNAENAHKVNAGGTTITQSNSQTITSANSVSCNANGLHADNHYLRVFDLPTFGINDDFAITNVSFGIETSTPAGSTQPVEVRLFTLEGEFVFANLTPIGSATAAVTSQSLTILDVPVTGTAPAGSKLVVDIFTPDGQTAGHSFFIGSNDLGETGPSYLAAADCGIAEPATTASLGFPEMMIVMNVTGEGGMSGPAIWLSEVPAEGSVPSDGMQPVVVTFDASKVNKPGTYRASAMVNSNDPENQALYIQTTMVVTAPANWGVLKGTISSLGYCDANPTPLGGATLTVTGSGGLTRTATTGANGSYEFWLPDYASPYTLLVTEADHLDATANGLVVIGMGTTTQDLSLRWIHSCVAETPPAISATVAWQASATVPMTLSNTGAAATPFKISEMPGTFTPMGVTGSQILIYGTSSSGNAMKEALIDLGYTYDQVSTLPTDLSTYLAVLYNGSPTTAHQTTLISYLDSGGRLVIADNDWGYANRTTVTPLYGTYFQATYVADTGSDGPIHGLDIMAGTDVDISSDPYPDSFKIGPDAIGIFANTAPKTDWAGMRIARDAYRAVYLAWDFHYAGSSAVGDAVETEIMGKILPWLTAADVDWLSATPEEGTLAANTGSIAVNVKMDSAAASVLQPGTYTARLKIETEDPENGTIYVPVTMIVNPSPTYGKVWGTVRGLGACDLNPAPIEGAQVDILVGTETITVETDANGYYQHWFTADYPTIGLQVTATDHLGEDRAMFFWPGADPRNQHDFDLHWLQPCGALTPASLSTELTMGDSTTLPAEIANTGWAPLSFSIRPKSTGFVPMGGTEAGEDVLLVSSTSTIADAVAASLTRLGFTFNRVTTSTLPPIATWTDYLAVIWAGSPSSTTNAGLIKSYLDAGGSFMITYNDFGYFYGTDTLYTDYLEVVYTDDDSGSDGTITGADIMAGVNLDISADPYPDSFTITGPNAVPIFTNDTPKTDLAGMRIAKNGYQAIYLSWNFQFTGTTDAEKDTVLGKAMTWLAPPTTWVQAAPNTGSVADHDTQAIEVTFNAGDPAITQPGTYLADLKMSNNTPGKGIISMPVTMIVNPPATWGKLQGTVSSLGQCDANPAPLVDELVTITPTVGDPIELKTDADGYYSYWFDAAASPVDIAVSPADHETGSASATITAGATTTQDFNLRLDAPCLSVSPTELEQTQPTDTVTTQTLTILNTGAADATVELMENDGGFQPPVASVPGKVPSYKYSPEKDLPGLDKSKTMPTKQNALPGISTSLLDMLIDEGFETTFPPDGWTQEITNPSYTWTQSDLYYYEGSYGALVPYDYDQDEWLLTPEFTLAEGTLSLYSQGSVYWCRDTNDNCDLNVWLVIGEVGGGDDIFVKNLEEDWSDTWVWTQATIDLAPFLPGGPVRIGFQLIGDDGADVAIDSIVLDGAEGSEVPWLTEDPTSFVIPADGSLDVTIGFDSTGLAVGDYLATLRVKELSGVNVDVPVTLHVTGLRYLYLPLILK